MKRRRLLLVLLCAAVVLIVAVLAVSLPRRPRVLYEVTFLPSLGGVRTVPHSINDRGQVVGVAETPARALQVFLWDKEGGLRDLGSFDAAPHIGHLLINNAGQIAGTTTDPNGHRRAFLWELSDGLRMLGTLGGSHSTAVALNDKGQIVGHAETSARHRHAFLWDSRNGMRDLGTLGGLQSSALSLNDAGEVVGWAETPEQRTHMFLWDPAEGMTDLGRAGTGPFRCHINNGGFVFRRFGTSSGKTHFSTWTKEAGSRDVDFIAVDTAEPTALNDANQVLIRGNPTNRRLFGRLLYRRHECYVWDPHHGVLLLEDHMSVRGLADFSVTSLNNQGWIVGMLRAKGSDQFWAVLLEPVEDGLRKP